MIGIVGAGPAGLVAAIAARQAGYDVTVFEQAPNFGKVGGAVGIQCNGLCALESIGLSGAIRPHLELTCCATLEAPPGRVVSRADFKEVDVPHHEFAVALRYDLLDTLLQAALAQGVEIQFGRRFKSARVVPEAIILTFDDGSSARCDLVLACDGIHSAVRESLAFRSKKRATNDAYLRLVAPRKHPDPSRIGEFWAKDGRRAGAFPLPGNRTYVFCSVPIGRWQDILNNGLSAWVASWDSFGEPISSLIRSIDVWENAVYDELHDIRVDDWSKGRVVLLGDAAHAMTPNLGQGANSAMVDAVVFMNLLVECGGERNWQQAGRRYQELRKPFVTRIQKAAWFGGQIADWRSAPARGLRDVLFRLAAGFGPMRRASMRLTAGFNPAEQSYLRGETR